MKRNLFAILLTFVMIAAVIFIAAPATKAETEADITLSADTTKTLVIDSDKVLNLNGFNATVSVNKGVTLTIVDTKFMEGDWNLDGTSAGTLTVAEGSEGTIKAWEQFGDYKYLAVKSKDGTYSAHPFNIMVSELGVNTYSSKITVGITVIADDVVAALIDAGEFGLRNYSLQGTVNADKEFTPHWKKFAGEDGKTNGLKGYVDLTGSLDSNVLTNNSIATVGAYIKVNAGNGDLIIDSFSQTGVSPLEILTAVNNNASNYTPEQKTKMVEMLAKEENAHLKEYCGKFLDTNTTIVYEKITSIDKLETGNYVIICSTNGYALGASGTVGNGNYPTTEPVKPTVDGSVVTATDDVICALTISKDDNGNVQVAIKDPNGYIVGVRSTNSGTYLSDMTTYNPNYKWTVKCNDDGTFCFYVTSACLHRLAYRGDKNSFCTRGATNLTTTYPPFFSLYKECSE